MNTDTRDVMIDAASMLREFARMDRVRLAILNAQHAETVHTIQTHERRCVDLARALHVAAQEMDGGAAMERSA